MAAKSRIDLKAIFGTNQKLTSDAFCDLIDSALIRKDDCFMGKWEAGVEYCNGNIVTHGKCFYMLVLPETEPDCTPMDELLPNNPMPKKSSGNGNGADKPGCICSTTPPSMDTKNWCKIATDCTPCQQLPPREEATIIEDTVTVLEDLCLLEPITYTREAMACAEEKKTIGVLCPEFSTDPANESLLSCLFDCTPMEGGKFDYVGMISVLIKAIQELKAENNALKIRVDALEGPHP